MNDNNTPLLENITILPVILSGGSGSRLWPLSTQDKPKQFHRLDSEHSLLQQTLNRCRNESNFAAPLIIGNVQHVDLIRGECAAMNLQEYDIIAEPIARNTAPAIGLAAQYAQDKYGDNIVMLVMPSDHAIKDVNAFQNAVRLSAGLCLKKALITIGITPDRPETGYGYIKIGDNRDDVRQVHHVDQFVEKPDAETAQKMVDSQKYLWNAGIFMFTAKNILACLQSYQAELTHYISIAWQAKAADKNCFTPELQAMHDCPSISIDHAVMELAYNIGVIPVQMGWSDIGNWDAIADISSPDDDKNIIIGPQQVSGNKFIDSHNVLIHADKCSITAIGIENLTIIESNGHILIMPRGQAQLARKASE
ncbi:hypothetical protein LPB140_09310 [Sphingorhabdus lutea]|uniref:Nucleotidyl transferase domain-containing protein n=1 Tax=Sphingorhabdus lutea TaxID=1913578 RepID=A0A1L3JCU6_9SPHN|nr:sugar phosphate nucleotidyltransferase [Sphingorhabdus lutea]APG62955.1 hypothetical protein LPB140_09310 [Sphingorhabdus lutea]